MSDIAVCAENLGKLYRIGKRERYRTLRDVIAKAFAAPPGRWRNSRDGLNSRPRLPASIPRPAIGHSQPELIWAVKDVSFEIKHGEVVGIIGRNGAGKSTLLKILSRITEPTEGEAKIYGRVGSLLEVGTGFHFELTGRENIYLNGAILGMKRPRSTEGSTRSLPSPKWGHFWIRP
jgi:lipopolysaccharide transport system ATP-binding protein